MTAEELDELAELAAYIGSGHHKDIPMFAIVPSPRQGAMDIDEANERGVDNPDCTICPRKWARRHAQVTDLLRRGIRLGQISADAASDVLPKKVWIRDPEDGHIVYEARRLSHPPNGYKAYPLTLRQTKNLPMLVL